MTPLWSDRKTEAEIASFSKEDIVYNLLEDIKCIKEEVQHWRNINWKLLDSSHLLVEAVKQMVE